MSGPDQPGLSDHAGAIAYFTFIPAVLFLIVEPLNKSAFVRFHAWQSIPLSIIAFINNIALSILMGIAMVVLPFLLVRLLWTVIELAWFLIGLLCVFNAYNSNLFKPPIICSLAAKQSGNKGRFLKRTHASLRRPRLARRRKVILGSGTGCIRAALLGPVFGFRPAAVKCENVSKSAPPGYFRGRISRLHKRSPEFNELSSGHNRGAGL